LNARSVRSSEAAGLDPKQVSAIRYGTQQYALGSSRVWICRRSKEFQVNPVSSNARAVFPPDQTIFKPPWKNWKGDIESNVDGWRKYTGFVQRKESR